MNPAGVGAAQSPRRRGRALFVTTALSATIAVFEVASPSAAQAVNECGSPVNGVVTCTSAGNPYPAGITYAPVTDLTVVLNPDVAATGPLSVATSGAGAIVVTNNGSISIPSSGAGGYGPAAITATSGTGSVSVSSNKVASAQSQGIFVESGGAVALNATSVTSKGVGVLLESTGATATGEAQTVSTQGDFAAGAIVTGQTGAGLAFGTISTSGVFSEGLFAQSNIGDIVVSGSNISTTGDFSRGVDARAYGAGASVNIDVGAVKTTGLAGFPFPDGPDSKGIFARTSSGALNITAGSISTAGVASGGINAFSLTGAVTIDAGAITTTGLDSRGINTGSGGAILVTAGDVTTSAGAGVIAESSGATATVNVQNVSTQGLDAPGVRVLGDKGADLAFGTISTGGVFARGVYAFSKAGDVVVSGTSVTTVGDFSIGVLAIGGASAKVNVGSVSTDGLGATGVNVSGGSGVANVVVSGAIVTHGDGAPGVFVSSDSGSVSVTGPSTSSITTTGAYSRGIDARAYGAGATVNLMLGSMSTGGLRGHPFGADSTGLFARSGDGAITAAAGSISTAGTAADGLNLVSNAGAITVEFGAISTSGAGARGVYAQSAGAILVTGASIVSNGAGVVAHSGAAYAAVNVQTVATRGPGDPAIEVFGATGANVAFGAVSTQDAAGVSAGSDQGSVVVSGSRVTVAGGDLAGISAAALNDASVNVGSVTTAGRESPGVEAISVITTASVTVANVTTLGDGSEGLRLTGKSVYVNATGAIVTHGAAYFYDAIAVDARFFADLATIKVNTITTYGAGARGVNAFGVGVAAVAVSGAIVTHGDNAPAIVLSTYGVSLNGNSISVTGPSSSSITTTGAYSRGIDARAYGAGSSANINIGSVTTSGLKGGFGIGQPNSTGIFVATSDGALSVAAGSISTAGVGADGVDAVSNSGPISVRVGSVSTTGEVGAGISAASVSGPISLQAASISTSGRASDAIDATSNGSISVSTGAVQTAGTGSLGILADSAADAATVTSQSVITRGDGGAGVFGAGGIYAEAVKTVVINSGAVTTYGAHADGIVAVSTSGNAVIDITGAGVNSAASAAVFAVGVQVSVTTAAGSAITGGLGGIRLESTGGSTLDLAGQVGSARGFAIQSLEGSVTVNNSGSINGAVSLPFGGDTVNNTGAFNAVGDSVFSAGDVFNNSGSVNILPGAQPAAGNVTFSGLATFNNTGLINLSNGRVGDTFTLPGVAFNGGPGSLLALDVNFGGSGSQTTCATATLADCLVLPGGSATGVTGVRITSVGTGPGQAASGIVVMDAPGGSIAPGAFVLDPGSRGFETRGGAGAVSSGFFFYRLVPLGATQEALVSAPDDTAFEFNQFGAAATDVWYATTGTWFDREADLREGPADSGAPAGHGDVWLKAVGDWTRRNSSQSTTSLGTTFTFDTSYRQSTAAIIGGADMLRGAGRAFVLGVDGGYVDSDVRFSASPTFAKLSGGVVGGYASLLSGRWYLDATVNYNFLTLNDTIPSVIDPSGTGSLAISGNVRSLGGQVESGWRLPVGAFSVEPLASIAYVRTRFDDLNVPGGSVRFGDVDSLRGSLGLRLSSDIHMADYTIKPSVFARAWDEFRGDENTALIDGGETVPGFDRFRGVFGDVGGQMAVFSKGGVAAFLTGDYKFKSNYTDKAVTVGIRYSF